MHLLEDGDVLGERPVRETVQRGERGVDRLLGRRALEGARVDRAAAGRTGNSSRQVPSLGPRHEAHGSVSAPATVAEAVPLGCGR